jgi:Fe-S-cluster-containing dehydrogenase component
VSGFVVLMSPCIGCGNPFSYNPHRVPSVRIDGERQPVCRSCVDRVNPRREANGLDPIVIQPGAYDAMPEEEL